MTLGMGTSQRDSGMCSIAVAPDVFEWLTPSHEPDIAWSDEAGGYTTACTCGWVSSSLLVRQSELGQWRHFEDVGRV